MKPGKVPETELTDDARRKANRRLGWILGSVAVLFFLGFMAKMMLLSR